jgi:Lrp/AsnC family leucine-responsive transcriptional regulator
MESTFLLDEVGRTLLDALQENARLSYAELGRRAGLSPSAVAERIRRMEDAGIIKGYRVQLDWESVGLPIVAYIRLTCDGDRYRPFLAFLKGVHEIQECHHITGGDAFMLKVVAASIADLEKLVEKLLHYGVPTTSIVLSSPVLRNATRFSKRTAP